MPPLPPGVSETLSAHARCPHRGAGRCGGSFGARLRVPKSAQSRGCGARGTSRRRFRPLLKSSHCVEGSRGGGLSCSVCLAASARGFCFVRGEKEAAVGRRVKGGGERREEKKNLTGGTAAAGLAQPGRERAGPAGGRVGQSLGKPPRGYRGTHPLPAPRGNRQVGGLPLCCQGTGFSLGIMLPHLQAPYQTLGRGKEEGWKGAGGTRGAEPVQGDTRGHQGQLAPP